MEIWIVNFVGVIMKFLVAFVGLFAVGNAATVLRLADPAVLPTVVSPAVIPSLVPHIPSVLPVADLAEWEAYKVWTKHFCNINHEIRKAF